jgi:hypothetical protein
MDAARQLTELTYGRLDVAVIRHVRVISAAAATVLAEDELGIACTTDDPLATREAVDPRELGDGRPILLPSGLAPTCQQAIIEHCQTLGFEPTGRYGVAGPESFLDALGAMFDRPAAALTPQITCNSGTCPVQLEWRPLEGRPPVLMTSALVALSHDWAAARNFVEALADGALLADVVASTS